MPTEWNWMEVRLPNRKPGESKTHWLVIRYERTANGNETTKSIRVTDCPLQFTLAPWPEGERVTGTETLPVDAGKPATSSNPLAAGTSSATDNRQAT